ncbi:T9SS type A sorting domain-containing protein [Kaistella polysaccharea]|uniref:T9SS type A sorting domain-containing protein n=1 Tax=Kaistella polysaccharea TaxID=2878534 RepID=UPI001CF4B708|nr:T9SS type A sorting domain-containing protein [Kaistella polysaccharea]
MKSKIIFLKDFPTGNKLFLSFVFTLFFALFSAQQIGDYKSITSGNWETTTTWGVWNGSNYVFNNTSPSNTTKSVTIGTNTVVTVATETIVSIGELIVNGRLKLNANLNLVNGTTQNLTIKTESTAFPKAEIYWDAAVRLTIPEGAGVFIDLNSNGGALGLTSSGSNGCTNNSEFYIGTAIYAKCTGKGNTPRLFSDVNTAGGTPKAAPSSDLYLLCKGTVANITGGPNGMTSYTWTYPKNVATGPNINNTTGTSSIQNLGAVTFTAGGNHTFTLKITTPAIDGNPSVSNTQSIVIKVENIRTYTGGAWDGGSTLPKFESIIINDNYVVSTSMDVCNCTINSGKTLTVNAAKHINISNDLINNGTLHISPTAFVDVKNNVNNAGFLNVTPNSYLKVNNNITNTAPTEPGFNIQNDGNLIQVLDTGTYTGTGKFIVYRDSRMSKNNYTYWSSPVKAQKLVDFSPNTATSRFYQYITSTDLFATVGNATNFKLGKGYAIMAPSTYTEKQTFTGIFKGAAHTGTITSDENLSAAGNGYNLVGNPYPSNIDFDLLYSQNDDRIYHTAYFWTNVDPYRKGTTNGDTAYAGNGYAIYNGTGGVAATSPATSPVPGPGMTSPVPTKFIKLGQGFIVKAKVALPLKFSNSIRVETDTYFFNMSKMASKDRFWLKLTTPAENVNTILIGYVPEATNGFEWDYDSPLFAVGSDSFYSILDDEKLGIQGRAYPLDTQDVVMLGTKHFETGKYTISLSEKEGIFAGEQSIYLKDKDAKTLTDLSKGDYTFTAAAGEYTNRFEIVYLTTTMGVGNDVKKGVEVYRDGSDFVMRSSAKNITTYELYDMSGRMIMNQKTNAKEIRFGADQLLKGAYILNAQLDGGERVVRKIIK